ncbi:MAG: trypsin-like peptidase domain-containing protein [Pirellulaceae bacterium]|jgi:S1-C subfamily serine protease|nr:trypsin-like peptidase domain-containing protein [Pirellulaceae bacterium]
MSECERDQDGGAAGPCVTDQVPPPQSNVSWEPSGPLRQAAARAEPPKDRVAWLMSATSLLLLLSIFLPYMVEKMTFAFTRGKQRALYELAGEKLQNVGLQDLSLAYQMIAHRVEPSVVHISVVAVPGASDLASGETPWPHPSAGQGSGIIVDPEGYIVTNAHVLFQASQIRVRLSDGRSVPATVVGTDRETDMAVLRVSAGDLIAAQWGDSDEIEVGALVWAVGSPLGLQRSVTFGILSGKHRSFTSEPTNGRLSLSGLANGSPYHDFLQTDAAVNPGNSGGPLVDARGRVIGVNTAIIGETYQGISLAIPSSIARPVYERIVRDGRVVRGWLGVLPRDLAHDEAASLGLDNATGALIMEVRPDSPAQRAGLLPNDVIIRWDDKPVNSRTDLFSRVALTEVGVPVNVVIVRDGATLTLQVTVVARPFGG